MYLKGKEVAQSIYEKIRQEMLAFKDMTPGLAFILVGDNQASKTYVNMKKKQCLKLGFSSEIIACEESVSCEELLQTIHSLNQNDAIHGILVQQPLPKHIDLLAVVSAISPDKDVDGFHPLNLGKLITADPTGFIPCTPLGIIKLLEYYKLSLNGKHVVVIGRSNIVGRPLSILLSQNHNHLNATVTLCHSKTKDLEVYTKQADVVIAAVGIPGLINAEMIKEEAIVIDVGMNRIEDDEGSSFLTGDVDFNRVAEKTSAITPVPGGVGPMTIAMLMQNTFDSFKRKMKK